MESRIGSNGSGIVGKVIEFDYPHTTDRRVDARLRRYERRRVRVEAVRDLESEPLDPLTIEQNPYLTRSGLLVTGLDRRPSFGLWTATSPLNAPKPTRAGQAFLATGSSSVSVA